MSSQQSSSPTYRYILLGAVLTFATMFAVVCFRTRRERRRHRQRMRILWGDSEAVKPPLFDAHLEPQAGFEWGELQPLAATVQGVEADFPSDKGEVQLLQQADIRPTRVYISVVVRMPAASSRAPDLPVEGEAGIPIIEFGTVEVDLHLPGAVQF